jgi:hypothetical protein
VFKIDKFTKAQAIEYANNEAELHGFKLSSDRWKKAFKHYLSFAIGTMSVGRNPREGHRYKALLEVYPEIFGPKGFSARMAAGYTDQQGRKGSDEFQIKAINDRIMSAVSNLMKLFENGGMGTRNTTKGNKPGKIPNSDMSQLQFPNKEDFSSSEEYEAVVKDVLYNWLVRDLITDCILESLHMYWSLDQKDVEDIMGVVKFNEATVKEVMGEGREEFLKRLRAQVKPKLAALNYKKLVLG